MNRLPHLSLGQPGQNRNEEPDVPELGLVGIADPLRQNLARPRFLCEHQNDPGDKGVRSLRALVQDRQQIRVVDVNGTGRGVQKPENCPLDLGRELVEHPHDVAGEAKNIFDKSSEKPIHLILG